MSKTDRKHRVTFRMAPDLVAALRGMPNQTAFVESTLREALARTCPLCEGRGRVSSTRLRVPDFRDAGLPRPSRDAAVRLREVVRLGKRLLATDLALEAVDDDTYAFRLARRDQVLLRGHIRGGGPDVTLDN